MSIDKMISQFKSMVELQSFATAQYTTILDQSSKIKKLEDEVKHLKKLLESTAPLIGDSSKTSAFIDGEDEATICRTEIAKLRDISTQRELTYEEAKKVDMYAKLLITLHSQPKSKDDKTKNMKEADLLLIAEVKDE